MQINRSLRVLFLLNSIFVFAGNMLGPLYAVYVQGIDSKIITISISWATLTLSTVVFMFLVGKFGDRVREKEFLLAGGFLVRALSWSLYIFAHNIYFLLAIQVFLGLGEALGTPAWNVIFERHLDGNKEIMDYSSWNILSNVIASISVIVGGIIAASFGFNFLFVIMSLLALVSFVGVLITPRRIL